MASTTKIMTALVALRDGQPDASITVTNDIHSLDGTGGSVMGLAVGQRFTLRELLYGLLVPSGDDAAVAIADGIAGSQSAFVARMNALALHLGLLHTHYVNVHGLDAPGHYTTALDLAWLTRVAMRVPLFHQIVGTASFTIAATATHPAFTLATTNKLLLYAGAFGVLGIKTGFTGNAGYCLVAEMSQTNRHVITVVFGEPDDTTRFTDSAALLAWGLATERGSRRAS